MTGFIWYRIEYADGVSANTQASSKQDARAKADKYHDAAVVAVKQI